MSNNALLNALVVEIAQRLEGWEAELRGEYAEIAYLNHTSGACLLLNIGCPEDRLEVCNTFPGALSKERYGLKNNGSIQMTASILRGAKAIAKDIQRKLASQAIETHAILVERHTKRVNVHQGKLDCLGNLVAPVNGKVYDGASVGCMSEGSFNVDGRGSGRVQVDNSLESGSLTLSNAPTALLEKVIETCAQYIQTNP